MNSQNALHEEHEKKLNRRVNGWLWRKWETPTGLKVLIYDILLSLFPTVAATIATALMEKNIAFLGFSYLLYVLFVVGVIMSRRIIAIQIYRESDLKIEPISLGIVTPALATVAVNYLLEDQMVVSLVITLGLTAIIALFSQLHLALPKEYRQRAEAFPITKRARETLKALIIAGPLLGILVFAKPLIPLLVITVSVAMGWLIISRTYKSLRNPEGSKRVSAMVASMMTVIYFLCDNYPLYPLRQLPICFHVAI